MRNSNFARLLGILVIASMLLYSCAPEGGIKDVIYVDRGWVQKEGGSKTCYWQARGLPPNTVVTFHLRLSSGDLVSRTGQIEGNTGVAGVSHIIDNGQECPTLDGSLAVVYLSETVNQVEGYQCEATSKPGLSRCERALR